MSLWSLNCLAQIPSPAPPEIHCKHFLYGYPLGAPATNDLIIRDIYALSSNDETKFADWVTYHLDRETVDADVNTNRRWNSDPFLDDAETLEPEDYRNAHAELGIDRGHQAPLGSFKGSSWWETNYLSNITPQRSNLNQGSWNNLESAVRSLVRQNGEIYVMTGPLYERDMPSLPEADESHVVPSGYWKIVAVKEGSGVRASAYILDQESPRSMPFSEGLVTVDEVEQRSRLDFFWELPDEMEAQVESAKVPLRLLLSRRENERSPHP